MQGFEFALGNLNGSDKERPVEGRETAHSRLLLPVFKGTALQGGRNKEHARKKTDV